MINVLEKYAYPGPYLGCWRHPLSYNLYTTWQLWQSILRSIYVQGDRVKRLKKYRTSVKKIGKSWNGNQESGLRRIPKPKKWIRNRRETAAKQKLKSIVFLDQLHLLGVSLCYSHGAVFLFVISEWLPFVLPLHWSLIKGVEYPHIKSEAA